MRRLKYVLIILCMCLSICFGGCGKEEYAQAAQEMGIVEEGWKAQKPESVMSLPAMWYNFSVYMDQWVAPIIIICIIGGWLLGDVFKDTPEIRKWARLTLGAKIPILIFLIVIVYKALYGVLNVY